MYSWTAERPRFECLDARLHGAAREPCKAGGNTEGAENSGPRGWEGAGWDSSPSGQTPEPALPTTSLCT